MTLRNASRSFCLPYLQSYPSCLFSVDLDLYCYCTFQSHEFWAIEVDHSQQSHAITDILQQVVYKWEVL